MIKYICDRCYKETTDLYDENFGFNNLDDFYGRYKHLSTETIKEVCDDCLSKLKHVYEREHTKFLEKFKRDYQNKYSQE